MLGNSNMSHSNNSISKSELHLKIKLAEFITFSFLKKKTQ